METFFQQIYINQPAYTFFSTKYNKPAVKIQIHIELMYVLIGIHTGVDPEFSNRGGTIDYVHTPSITSTKLEKSATARVQCPRKGSL